MPARYGVPVDLVFPKSLEFYLPLQEKKKCLCMCRVRQIDGWCKCVPGLCFMKVKGPWGWSGKHIISVIERGWMNRAFIIKHLQYERALSWCWGLCASNTILLLHVCTVWAQNENAYQERNLLRRSKDERHCYARMKFKAKPLTPFKCAVISFPCAILPIKWVLSL